MYLLIRGAGDLASGIALRLHRAGYRIWLTDVQKPLAVRWRVSFCSAIPEGRAEVEGVQAVRVEDWEAGRQAWANGQIPIWVDPDLSRSQALPIPCSAVVDAILAKRNLGLHPKLAPCVIGVGPGFIAPDDCHAVVETMRGHTLGRVYTAGSALPNTGVPGAVGGYTSERLLRAPAEGIFEPCAQIGEQVEAGQTLAYVGEVPMRAEISGILRGLLQKGTPVQKGLKAGDIDPRCEPFHCWTVSDKALAIGGGVLEALLQYGIFPEIREGEG